MRAVNTGKRWRLPWMWSFVVLLLGSACGGPNRHYEESSDTEGGSDFGGSSSGGFGASDSGGTTGTTGTTGNGGSAGETLSAQAGTAGTLPVAGAAGVAGGWTLPRNTTNRFATVTGGLLMASKNYRLLVTAGEAPAGNSVMKSTNYKLQCGFVGVAQ